MKVFNVIMGLSRINFSMWALNGKYQARVNDIVLCESTDYELVRETLLDQLHSNVLVLPKNLH